MTMTTSAIPMLRNHDILTSLLKGHRLTEVARDYGVSKQRIHQIVHNFKNTSKDSPEYQQYQNYVIMKTNQKTLRSVKQQERALTRTYRATRNQDIRAFREGGMAVPVLAEKFSLTPQQIYHILKSC